MDERIFKLPIAVMTEEQTAWAMELICPWCRRPLFDCENGMANCVLCGKIIVYRDPR